MEMKGKRTVPQLRPALTRTHTPGRCFSSETCAQSNRKRRDWEYLLEMVRPGHAPRASDWSLGEEVSRGSAVNHRARDGSEGSKSESGR